MKITGLDSNRWIKDLRLEDISLTCVKGPPALHLQPGEVIPLKVLGSRPGRITKIDIENGTVTLE